VTEPPVSTPPPTLAHLSRITDDRGIVEHALFARPRVDATYCTDDAGRLLALSSRLAQDRYSMRLALSALSFLERAHRGEATFLLRHDARGTWDSDVSDDATGRALLGLATAAAFAPWPDVRSRSLALFDQAASFRSGHLRAAAYAALGAATLLREEPDHESARALLDDAPDFVTANAGESWPWPEARLSYANALLPLAALALAEVRDDATSATHALGILEWLARTEILDDHFSFTPVAGRGLRDERPQFDQQPIEAWAMTEACAFAYQYTRDAKWHHLARLAGSWFLGNNDVGVLVYDPATGGGYDGLAPDGVNLNQGAESTLSFVATMRELRVLETSPRLDGSNDAAGPYATSRRASSR